MFFLSLMLLSVLVIVFDKVIVSLIMNLYSSTVVTFACFHFKPVEVMAVIAIIFCLGCYWFEFV